MLFNSHEFILGFVPIALLGYELISRWLGRASAVVWLVLASLFFYGWWNPPYLILLLGSALANFGLGRWQERIEAAQGGPSKPLLVFTIVLNLGLLGYFKYFNFFVRTANNLFDAGLGVEQIILPLAISFYTFQQIAYGVDVYAGKVKNSPFMEYLLFVTFFPQLIAGPIVHHKEMIPQLLTDRHGTRLRDLSLGIAIFTMGLFKKVIIADSVSPLANPVFGAAAEGEVPGLIMAWVGAMAYTMQLYFDFSGYSDMAIGLGRMFGVRIPQNFNSPYKSRSISEFWRRWHMTLSRFLRDYLYIPLGGNRYGSGRRYLNLMLTMLLGGLWHGAGWTFVFWGFLHGSYLMVNHAWQKATRGHGWAQSAPMGVFYWVLTFLCAVVGWVFFRATSFESAGRILYGMVGGAGLGTLGIRNGQLLSLIAVSLISWFGPNTQTLFGRYRPAFDYVAVQTRASLSARPVWAFVLGAMFGITLLGLNQVSEFLYYQF